MFGFGSSSAVVPWLVLTAAVCLPGSVLAGEAMALPGAVDAATLEDQRAMYKIPALQLGQITSNAQVAETFMEGAFTSGDNILEHGALENAQGMTTVIQNSGHNVVIQESLMLNVHVAP
jgi:hypothetical protein